MAVTNPQRVGKALDILKEGLETFVERELKSPGGGAGPAEEGCGRGAILSDVQSTSSPLPEEGIAADVIVRGTGAGFEQEILAGRHRLAADEPAAAGGADTGPTPYDFLLAALGS